MIPGSVNPLLAGATSYLVQNSLRFKSASSGLLARTIGSSSTSTTTCTLSFWIKRGAFGSGRQTIFYTGNSSGTLNIIMIEFTSGSQLLAYYNGAGSTGFTTSAVFRDPSAWYHIVHAYDSTQATDSNRIKLYINGNQNSSFSSINYPALNQAFSAGATDIQRMMGFITTQFVDGYLAESHFVDGQALTPSSFGETDNVTGVWVPKKYTGTYGTNGFYLEFKDASAATNTAIGKDSSGNGNHFTPSGVSVTSGNTFDQMVDTPTLNYATWSPIDTRGGAIPTAGNLNPGVGNSQGVRATIGVTSGKWYWEHRLATASTDYTAGITNQEPLGTYLGSDTNSIGYAATGNVLRNASVIATYGNWNTSGKIVAFALDQDNKTIQMFVDGVSQNAAFAHLLTGTIFPAINFGTGYGTPVGITNFGQQPFTYTPPTGFMALNSNNLLTPTIQKSSLYFDAITYTGNGSTSNVGITGTSFTPDFIWFKRRDSTTNGSHVLIDSSRFSGLITANTYISNTALYWKSYPLTYWQFGLDATGTGVRGGGSLGTNVRTGTYYDVDIDANTPFEIEYQLRGIDTANAQGTVAIYRKQDQANIGTTLTNYFALGMFSATSTHWVGGLDPASTIGLAYIHSAASVDAAEEKSANLVSLTSNVATTNVFVLAREADGNLKAYRTNAAGSRVLIKTHSKKTNSIMRIAINSSAEGNFLGLQYLKVNLLGDVTSTAKRYASIPIATDGEDEIEEELVSFNSNGFTIKNSGNLSRGSGLQITSRLNINTASMVSWAWRENPSSGFDVVTYSGTGANTNVSHSLGVTPSMIIVKQRAANTAMPKTSNWPVWHKDIANTSYILLTGSAAGSAVGATYWNNITPNSTTFSVGTSSDTNGDKGLYIAYLWSEVAGFSRFGSYTGNGSTDGPFVWCGFRPRFVMIKRSDSTDSGWMLRDAVRDTYNNLSKTLSPFATSAESAYAANEIDFLSNGFKLRHDTATGYSNASGGTYIFAAFAETPFKYARAR